MTGNGAKAMSFHELCLSEVSVYMGVLVLTQEIFERLPRPPRILAEGPDFPAEKLAVL